jgi:hypothetical protein
MTVRSRRTFLLPLAGTLMLFGCGSEPQTTQQTTSVDASTPFPSKKIDASPPYIVQEGCKFFLVTDDGTISTTSERNSGPSGNATLNMGGHRMVLSDCALAENPGNLPVH